MPVLVVSVLQTLKYFKRTLKLLRRKIFHPVLDIQRKFIFLYSDLSTMDTAKKLRIKENTEIVALHAPAEYKSSLGKLPAGVRIKTSVSGNHNHIHIFIKNTKELEKYLVKTVAALNPEGLLWIFYPKAGSGIPTDLTRDKGWDALHKVNMQWLSLVSFNDNWTGFLMKNAPPKTENKTSEAYHENAAKYTDAKTKTVIVPGDLKKAFGKNKKALAFYESLSYTNRKEYVMWIVSAKREETRKERVEKTILKLNSGKLNPAAK
jgi:hypothetical protein